MRTMATQLVSWLSLCFFSCSCVAQQLNNNTVRIPNQYTYLLPDGFEGNVNSSFVNGTTTDNNTVSSLLSSANKAPFIVFDDEFLDIIGQNAQPRLVSQRDNDFAYEAGVWVPEKNEVWFTSAVEQGEHYPPTLYSYNLNTDVIAQVNTTPPVINPNGGYYYNGSVWMATYPNNQTYRGGVVAVNVNTLQATTVVNSYYGLPFNGVDDVAWASNGSASYMFFTDLEFASDAYPNLPPEQVPANVYRWDPQAQEIKVVIPRGELNPNGVRVSPDMKTLYVTDSSATQALGASETSWLGPYIYAFDLNDSMLPVNRRLFGFVREGIADGLHIDDAGNVWTGEYEGVVVRNPSGKVIGIFNAQYFQQSKEASALPIANFALAGDTLVFLSTTRLWTVKLAKTVVSADSSIVN